jgi:hypothetical protein
MKTISIEQTGNMDITGKQQPGVLNLLKCKCPRCREGNMFRDSNPWHLKHTMSMHETCPVCKQPLNIEVGFYYGSGFISYGLSVALSAISFIAWWLLVGISVNDNRVLYWIPFNAVFLLMLQPYLMRVSRTGWLALFVRYDKHWEINPPKPLERINKEQENNW